MSIVPPYLKRAQTPDKGRAGRKAETSLAQRLGGQQVPGSGALSGAKGDVRKADFLVENKSSTNASFSIKQDVLIKIYQEALDVSKMPALAFQFVNSEGQSAKRDRWVCVPEHIWEEMVNRDV